MFKKKFLIISNFFLIVDGAFCDHLDQCFVSLATCASEMIEEQYDEGESVRVGLEYLVRQPCTQNSYCENEVNSCLSELKSFKKMKSPRGASFEYLKGLAREDERYSKVIHMLLSQRQKLVVQSVTRRGLSLGVGLALTCGYQTKILKTPLGRRYKSRRALFPVHTGVGAVVYQYEDSKDVRAGDYRFDVNRRGFVEQKCQRPRALGCASSHFRERPYEVFSSIALGYGSFYKQRSEHWHEAGLLMEQIVPDFQNLFDILMSFVKRDSRSSTMFSDLDLVDK